MESLSQLPLIAPACAFIGPVIGLVIAMGAIPSPDKPRNSPDLPPTLARAVAGQQSLWQRAKPRPEMVGRLDAAVDSFIQNRARYDRIAQLYPGGVPAPVIFCLHGRESSWSFRHHLHEGSPLTGRTRYVPKGRPKDGSPPFTFEQSATDALYVLKNMHQWDWGNLSILLQNVETYNGLGYQRHHPDVPSPYLWAGTTVYSRGKYIADGRFSAMAVDRQLGCAAILKRMADRGVWSPPKQ